MVITILRKRLYHAPNIMLLLNLALTDILFLLIHMPDLTVTGIAGEYIWGRTDMERCQTCIVTGFIPVVLLFNSLQVSALMSITVFLFIYKPLKYERMVNKKKLLLVITVAAILSIALGLCPLASPNKFIFLPGFQGCHFALRDNWYVVSVVIASALAAITVIVICNIWIVCIVQKNIKQIYSSNKIPCRTDKSKSCHTISERMRKERHKKQLHLFYTFGCLLLSNFITWLPHLTFTFLSVFIDFPVSILSLGRAFFLSQAAVHPIIYTFLIKDVREPLKKIVMCGFLKKANNLAVAEEQTCSYSICYGCGREDNNGRCFIFKLLDEALLHYDNSSSSTQVTNMNGKSGSERSVECEPANNDNH